MDFLDIVMELRKRHRIQIPEDDYINLASMNIDGGVSRAADEGHRAREGVSERVSEDRWSEIQRSELHSLLAPLLLAPAMYDTIIIGAGMSRAGGRDSAGVLRPARLHSRAALHDRRAELVLPPPRPRLRRRPARAHELHAQGHEDRSARPAAAATAAVAGTISPSRRSSARRSRFPACGCGSTTTPKRCATKSPGRFRTQVDNFDRLTREIVDYDDLERSARRPSRPARWSARSSPIRCWSRCCSAR